MNNFSGSLAETPFNPDATPQITMIQQMFSNSSRLAHLKDLSWQ